MESVSLNPDGFGLFQNVPNPFNPGTTIFFSVKEPCRVMLGVYDLQGREVSRLVNSQYLPGEFDVQFDASGLASGIYFYRIRMGNFSATRKMIVLE